MSVARSLIGDLELTAKILSLLAPASRLFRPRPSLLKPVQIPASSPEFKPALAPAPHSPDETMAAPAVGDIQAWSASWPESFVPTPALRLFSLGTLRTGQSGSRSLRW